VGAYSVVPKIQRSLGGKPAIGKLKMPVLCICLGLQALFEQSEESRGVEGLGVMKGSVQKIRGKVRLPQLGWNRVKQERKSELFDGIDDGEYFYFANSYAAFPSEKKDVLCSTEYGERFASAVCRGNWFGVQFHPEKSGKAGQRLIANFAKMCDSKCD
jgi:glutamine amidotransferase